MSSAFVFNRFRLVSLSYKKGDDGSEEQELRFLPSIQRGLEAKIDRLAGAKPWKSVKINDNLPWKNVIPIN